MSEEFTSCEIPPNDFDDSINLESKVLLALSRLQNGKTTNKKTQEGRAVSCSNVVQFLKNNYPWLDGDIQSQVKTALLSFIKIGIVCILDNAKYRLLLPNSKVMSNICSTRITHGPNCCCLFTLKCMLSNPPNVCCLLKHSLGGPRKKINAPKKNPKKKPPGPPASGRNSKPPPKKTKRTKCVLDKKNSNARVRKKTNTKCSICSEVHPPKPKKACRNCNNVKTSHGVPIDVFSPRDEAMDTSS